MSRLSRRKRKKKQKSPYNGQSSSPVVLNEATTSMHVSRVTSRKKISKDKSPCYVNSTLGTPSSRMLEVGSTFQEKGYRSYFNSSVLGWSRQLYVPTVTDCADLDSNSSNSFSNNTASNSWFTFKTKRYQANRNSFKTSSPSTPSTSAKCKGEGQQSSEKPEPKPEKKKPTKKDLRGSTMKSHSVKMKMNFNFHQSKLLKTWMGCCRKVFNHVTSHFHRTKTLLSLTAYRDMIVAETEKNWPFMKSLPYNSREETIKEAMSNIKTVITWRLKEPFRFHSVPMRTKKNNVYTLPVRAQNINKEFKIYPGILFSKDLKSKNDDMTDQELGVLKTMKTSTRCKWISKTRKNNNHHQLEIICDSHLTFHRRLNEYYLALNTLIPRPEVCDNQAASTTRVVALDPGNRTFLTFYSPNHGIGKIGNEDIERLYRLCWRLDKLISTTTKVEARKRNKFRKAQFRIRKRIRNLRDEIHRKTANFLTTNFDVIVLPHFNPSQTMFLKSKRNINSKTVRGLLTWAHSMFETRLKDVANRLGKTVLDPGEYYTSKTCSSCGTVDSQLGASKVFRCPNNSCNLVIDRDVNGARGILLRALLDGSLTLAT